jgi:hypothetical protein
VVGHKLAVLVATPTARHFVEVLDLVAVLVFVLHVANIDEPLIAAVGPQALKAGVVGLQGVVGGGVRYSIGVHSASYSVGRVPGCATTAGAIFTSSVYYKYLHTSTNMIGYFL